MPKMNIKAMADDMQKGRGKPKDDDKGYGSSLAEAMEDMQAAMKSGDMKAAARAFRAAHDLCAGE